MNKKLVLAFVLVPLAFVTLILVIGYKNHATQKPAVLADQSIATSPGNPKLEIYDYNVYLKYSTSNEWIEARDKEEILPGTQIKTDNNGRAQLVYPNGTVTRLDNSTEITLSEYEAAPQKVSIYVTVGTIWSRITKLLGGESYRSESKNLVATVRGTIYEHTVLASGEDEVSVDSHVVHIACSKTKVETDVSEDQKTETSCATKPVVAAIPAVEKQTKWVTFNKEEDKKLKNRFKNAKYDEDDEDGKKTQVPAATPSPTPTTTPTPTPTPLPLSITGINLVCSATGSARSIPQVLACGDGHTKIEVEGTGFTPGVKVYAIPVIQQTLTYLAPSPTPISSDFNTDSGGDIWPDIKNSNDMVAHFSSALGGTYYVRISLNSQIVDTNATFTSY